MSRSTSTTHNHSISDWADSFGSHRQQRRLAETDVHTLAERVFEW